MLSDNGRESLTAMWARLIGPGSDQDLPSFITEADESADVLTRRLSGPVG